MDNCTLVDLAVKDEGNELISDNEKHENLTNGFVHDARKLCRLCAHHTEKSTFIFGEPGIEQHLALKINAYLPVTVNKSDVLPKQLCMTCINKLHIISEFSENCLHAEEQLRRNMEPKILKSHRIKSDISLLNNCVNPLTDVDKSSYQPLSDIAKVYTHNYKPMLLMSDNSTLPCPLCFDGKMASINKTGTFMERSFDEKYSNDSQIGSDNLKQQTILDPTAFDDSVELLTASNETIIQNEHIHNNEIWESKIVDVPNLNFHDDCQSNANLPVNADDNDNEAENNKHRSNKDNNIALCQFCHKTFESIEICVDHCKSHFPSRETCHICHFQFDCEQHWLNHIKEHILCTQLQVHDHYLCQDCNQLFETHEAFSVHSCPYKPYDKCTKIENSIIEGTSVSYHSQNNSQSLQSTKNVNQENMISEVCNSEIKMQNEKEKLCCQFCLESFTKKDDFTNHIQSVHPDASQYACEICGEKFQNQFVLQYHYASHMNLSSLQCVFCGLTFATQAPLHQHVLSQHPKLIPPQPCYKCNTCQETYTNLDDSVTHISTHLPNEYEQNHEIEEVHISQLYMCEYCESCFIAKSILYQHYFTHSKDSRYVCKICNTTFTSYGRLSKHKLLHNDQNTTNGNSPADISTVVKLFVCQECEKCYTQWNSLNNHRRNCHQNSHSYTCKICNESFNLYAEYQDHRKIHPAQMKSETDGSEKEYLCDYCQKTFHHHSTLALHQRIHLKGQPYACEICGETFRLKSTYDKHFRKHTGVKPYICDVCGKGFTQNSGLYTHRRVHTGEKPYACDLCGKNFRLKHDRDNHRRCHTGERPYQCNYCGKAFRTSHDHRQHLLIHTGQRPYRCDYCNKGFRRINGLNVHKRIHTGEKPYGCAICGRHFTQKGDMMKHCKTQHGNTF